MMSGTTLRAEQCVRACASRAWRLASCLVWNSEDALDVVQQACLVAASKPAQVPADDPWPWFARVVTLEALKLRQSRAKAARLGDNLRKEAAVRTVDAALEAERKELQGKLRQAMNQLPVEQRDALALTHIAGLTVRDAAQSLGVSSSTIDRRVQQGLATLRQRLGREQSVVCAGLLAFSVDSPPQGMESALQSWLGTVQGQAVPVASIQGGISMKIAVLVGLGVVAVVVACGCLLHMHPEWVGSEEMREFHDMLWRAFHGK